MADTKHGHAAPMPVEGDGVSYRGIFWFLVILTVTTLFCQALVWGMFEYWEYREARADPARAPLAAPTGMLPPTPNLLVDEPTNLKNFHRAEGTMLSTYGWVNKDTGLLHIPINVAKDKLLQKGLTARPAAASASAPAAEPAAATVKTEPAAGHKGGNQR